MSRAVPFCAIFVYNRRIRVFSPITHTINEWISYIHRLMVWRNFSLECISKMSFVIIVIKTTWKYPLPNVKKCFPIQHMTNHHVMARLYTWDGTLVTKHADNNLRYVMHMYRHCLRNNGYSNLRDRTVTKLSFVGIRYCGAYIKDVSVYHFRFVRVTILILLKAD